ncbi:hypothetical protein RB196_01255 [Streptomyces sp. PmtA]|uniref:hypothetical protein n=1 Tax=Streptomyces sp. PmtA TaxID=3074275 RepID=UPI003014384B
MPPGLTADWALWGKEPHTNSGYKVLAACPPDRSADFNRDIHRWSPGTPAPGDRLPWITLGPCTAPDGTPTVGIFLLEGTDAVDRTNRPICRIDHFAVPAAEVSGLALSWCGLARAALDAVPQLAAAGAAPARLPVAPGGRLVTQVTAHVGPRVTEAVHWLAAAAGYLLDGTVVVTGGRMYDPLVLLDVLDCVAAMLPFGMRRTLSAATWVSSGSEVPMRLYWGVPERGPRRRQPGLGRGTPGRRRTVRRRPRLPRPADRGVGPARRRGRPGASGGRARADGHRRPGRPRRGTPGARRPRPGAGRRAGGPRRAGGRERPDRRGPAPPAGRPPLRHRPLRAEAGGSLRRHGSPRASSEAPGGLRGLPRPARRRPAQR